MRNSLLYAALAAAPLAAAQAGTVSSKRGLVYVATDDNASDDKIWVEAANADQLTWYYNYAVQPTTSLKGTDLNFVPMMWGTSDEDDAKQSTAFRDGVRALVQSGVNITHVLGFNEPDGSTDTGGSNIPADLAASTWKREIEPLRDDGIKVGAPAVTGSPTGFQWLQNFFTACDGGCNPDFIPVHWYGNWEGFASHLGQVGSTYQNMSEIWVTEFAYSDAGLTDSEWFFNTTMDYLDTKMENVTRYSWFGSFRSSVSNVGENAAMLNSKGKLTDLGAWYLGQSATGVEPDSAAGKREVFAGWTVVVCLASLYALW
ncbi:Glycoside hydrolase subgroup catalytic core [Lasiodiplodia theobromae]|uniref:Alkali-sensitive linkage protein 1 n=1 Tax=Lasiodiplodia theobromae TaxID=45133 RepID=A0A5N5CWW6_9PEZI|nr:Glycoside hydrolase subgroup catalytic core [Lasiodiplodia theobromae]KAB2569857.1 Alkali-sensitive linkage protein 1 [Lasiodiplodia theobromae]KAF4536633.1 Glycoside hydrolase subgroup catalytic core [Lasiodiplodia theobromae]KAF9634440.1 Glycoside hydrolase subgroup catalytic core [Lasiodiplodia theobromae]